MSTDFKSPQLRIALAEKGDVPKRVQLLRAGVYHDPRYGEFAVTKDTLLSMKKNFDDRVLKIDVAIDYAHESDKVAAGWIKKLSLENDGTELWADEVDWTPKGAKVLGDKEFRYLSADFTDNYVDNQTLKKYGPTLRGAGLTNRPVVKGMAAAVQLQEGKNEMAKLEELEVENKKLKEEKVELEKQLAAKKAAQDDNGDDDGDEMKKKCDDLMAENSKMKKQLDEYAEKFGKMEADKKAAEKKSEFDKMLSEGKAVEAQREPFMKDDMPGFVKLAQPVNLGSRGHGGDPVIKEGDVDARIIKAAEKLVADKKAADVTAGMSKVLAENIDGLRVEKYGK